MAENHSPETILQEALDLADLQARAAYLDDACGEDRALRHEVESLLAAHSAAADTFMGTLADRGWEETPTEKEGDTIGRYKLLQQIGEGGGGTVYMADQIEPVKRRVALKVIKLGMDTRQVVARFEAERQALALMDHPNIAKVFDAGATESGRPYFVMELVNGVPITRFCDENMLSTKERLVLFIQVCEAVQHAHQKGIIHRDLKPGNILVTMMEDRPLPKVIDFGIAKATQQELTEKTLFTLHGHFIGTPAYMSPEQASMTGYDIDTRSDIYALGVVLYELLCGKTPFDSTALLKAGYDEIRRVIAEDEPSKPSARLSSLGEGELTTLATYRHTGPKRLSKLMRGDLDWVVMKALEKDRRRRYETANGFARDVQRFLDQAPVTAGPPGIGYKMRKFARRNKVALTAAGTFAVVLLTATGISRGQAIRATQAEGEVSELLEEVSGLLEESTDQRRELQETVTLLTESTDELESHMRRFLIGTWDTRIELDEERGEREMGAEQWKFLKGLFASLVGETSSQIEFKDDGTTVGTAAAPPPREGFLGDDLKDRKWELVKQHGKHTTVLLTGRGLGGIKHIRELTLTVLDSDTLQMEDSDLKDQPFKPITFERLK